MCTQDMIKKYIDNGGTITKVPDKLNGSDTKEVSTRTSRTVPISIGYKPPYRRNSTSINYTGSHHDIRNK